MEIYREVQNFPTVIFTQGRLGIINVDFTSANDCLVTCTDDM